MGQEEQTTPAHCGFCTEAEFPCPPWITPGLRNNLQALSALPAVFFSQRQSPASCSCPCRPGTEPQTHLPHPGESLAASSPLSELESNAKSQPDLWWLVVFFLLFDSKYPGTCFLTSVCIHAENKQSLYKTPNISP